MKVFICLTTFSQLHTLHSVAVVNDLERLLVEMFVVCFKVHSELSCTGLRKNHRRAKSVQSICSLRFKTTNFKRRNSATYSTTRIGVTNYVPPYVIMYLSVSVVGLWNKCMSNSSISIDVLDQIFWTPFLLTTGRQHEDNNVNVLTDLMYYYCCTFEVIYFYTDVNSLSRIRHFLLTLKLK
jgi:hypothetical protein